MGYLTWEKWETAWSSNLTTLKNNPDFPDNPSESGQLTEFDAAVNVDNAFGQRISGFIHPAVTGNYIFWIAGDDQSELWLSTNADPAAKTLIADSPSWTNHKQWDRFSSQQSAEISLEAGQVYYIEALGQEGGGGDNLSVAWQIPGSSTRQVIGAEYISPSTEVTNRPIPTATPVPPAATPTPVPSGPTPTPLPPTTNPTGSITWQKWDTSWSSQLSTLKNNPNFPDSPDTAGRITSFETARNADDTFGQRIVGYIYPPTTGEYTFWISGDDETELWLSSDNQASGANLIANSPSWTGHRQWDRHASQQSVAINLTAGQPYYIEALAQEGGGGDHLSVAWQLPGSSEIEVIDGQYLAPLGTP